MNPGNVNVVLAHGAWADGSSWSKVIDQLSAQGIRAIAAPLLTAAIGLVAWLGWSAKTVPHGPSMCVASAAAVGLAVL